jgi:hypothetical protein
MLDRIICQMALMEHSVPSLCVVTCSVFERAVCMCVCFCLLAATEDVDVKEGIRDTKEFTFIFHFSPTLSIA